MPLLQIYIPLIDDVFHWFLIVISIDECKVYKLDTFRSLGRIDFKEFGIHTVVRYFSHRTDFYSKSPSMDTYTTSD